jgi:hypothetical protein
MQAQPDLLKLTEIMLRTLNPNKKVNLIQNRKIVADH